MGAVVGDGIDAHLVDPPPAAVGQLHVDEGSASRDPLDPATRLVDDVVVRLAKVRDDSYI
jgi:hypothetical protein